MLNGHILQLGLLIQQFLQDTSKLGGHICSVLTDQIKCSEKLMGNMHRCITFSQQDA